MSIAATCQTLTALCTFHPSCVTLTGSLLDSFRSPVLQLSELRLKVRDLPKVAFWFFLISILFHKEFSVAKRKYMQSSSRNLQSQQGGVSRNFESHVRQTRKKNLGPSEKGSIISGKVLTVLRTETISRIRGSKVSLEFGLKGTPRLGLTGEALKLVLHVAAGDAAQTRRTRI